MQPRWSLAGLSGIVAVVLGWAAMVLPWSVWSTFSVVTTFVAIVHAVTAGLALVGHEKRLSAWRFQSAVALGYTLYCVWNVTSSAAYVATLYGSLGSGIAIGLAACLAILGLLTVPLSVWGIVVTGGIRKRRRAGVASLAALLAAGAGWLLEARAAEAAPTAADSVDDWTRRLAAAVPPAARRVATPGPARSLMSSVPARCERSPVDPGVTILATYRVVVGRSNAVRTSCVQADSPDEALADLREILADATRGPVKLDVVTGVQRMPALPAVVDSMMLRPGFDGVCTDVACLAPWQLVAMEVFIAHRPLPFVPELRFGFDPAELRESLHARPAGAEGLIRIETRSVVVDAAGEGHELVRDRVARNPEPSPEALAMATHAAQEHVLAAQLDDGKFRYIVNPHSGDVTHRGFAMARQAGTTLVLCELGEDDPAVNEVIGRALGQLASLEQRFADMGALRYPAGRTVRRVDLGPAALSLVAFLSCRERLGDEHDALIGRLARYLLRMQRPDGGFFPRMDTKSAQPIPGPDPLYAGGQAVYALTLLEKLAAEHPSNAYPKSEDLHVAVDRSMTYFAEDYWPPFVRDFFFIEENWHCMAARASLGHHRHEGYERFCLDYVTFKSRLILDEHSEVDPTLVGAYGFGNIVLPHNTGSAGFGEALAAAMAVKRARGEDLSADRSLMRTVLRFLLRQQWTDVECYACAPGNVIVGGMSEHIGSPHVRIDYVQHSWAAMGHGARMLED